MRKLQWLKTKAGLFQDTRIMYLLSQPHGDALFVLWFFLKDLAASADKDGKIYVASDVPVTAELLARSLHKRKSFIEKGLDVLEQIELIRRDEAGILEILIWDDLQDFRRDDVRREQNRQAAARYRQRQKEKNGGEATEETGEMAQYEADTAQANAVSGNAGRDKSVRVDTAAQTGAESLANTQDCRDMAQDSADAEDIGSDTTAQTERKASARTPSCREVPPEPAQYDDCREETGRVDEGRPVYRDEMSVRTGRQKQNSDCQQSNAPSAAPPVSYLVNEQLARSRRHRGSLTRVGHILDSCAEPAPAPSVLPPQITGVYAHSNSPVCGKEIFHGDSYVDESADDLLWRENAFPYHVYDHIEEETAPFPDDDAGAGAW